MSSPFSCSQLGSRRSSILPFFPSFFYAVSSLPRIDNHSLFLSLFPYHMLNSPLPPLLIGDLLASSLPSSSFPFPLFLHFCSFLFSRCVSVASPSRLICLLFDPNYDSHGRRIRASDREKNSRALDRESERTIGQQSDVRRAR